MTNGHRGGGDLEQAGAEALGLPDLLAAEQASSRYWREVARQRRVDAARVQRRPLVRAAIALDRRTAPAQKVAVGLARRGRGRLRRAIGVAAAVPARHERSQRRQDLAAQVQGSTQPVLERDILLMTLGPVTGLGAHPRVHHVDLTGTTRVHQGGADERTDLTGPIDHLVLTGSAPLVCVLGPTAQPLHEGWLAHLAAPLAGDVVATTPLVLHPDRTGLRAGRQDLLVRWIGFAVHDDRGVPTAHPVGAGDRPDLGAPVGEVTAASGSAIVVDRRAWLAAGGLAGTDPAVLDTGGLGAALFDLSVRLHQAGGTILGVPGAVLVDDRPDPGTVEPDPSGVTEPTTWSALVGAHGPALLRLADGGVRSRPATVAITTATPSRKIASHSGDWHYAGFLADALRRAGHDVRMQSIDEANSLAGRSCDVHLVLRGLEPVRRTTGQRHVLWVISHPEALDLEECEAADLVLVASARYATHLRSRISTPVEVLLQATDQRHFRPMPAAQRHRSRVTVVANSRGVLRPAVADSIAAGLTPAIYGHGWQELVDPALVVADYARIDDLPAVYSSAEVVLNDHWETMRLWGFVSNRIFDVLACGTPVLSDFLPEIPELFGDLVPTWRTADELAAVIEDLRANPEQTTERVARARRLVLDAHTFDHRARQLAEALARHGLVPEPVGS